MLDMTAELESVREGVRQSLPEIALIQEPELREQVIEAHALALVKSEFRRIEDIPPSGIPGSPLMKRGTQADHYRGVARMAMGMADQLEHVMGPLGIDRDILLASALCHDVGKTFEFDSTNLARWKTSPRAVGNPSIRHPVYGVYIALTAGLPEAVAHCVGAHSMNAEGAFVTASLETVIVQFADIAFWRILEGANLLEDPNPQEKPWIPPAK